MNECRKRGNWLAKLLIAGYVGSCAGISTSCKSLVSSKQGVTAVPALETQPTGAISLKLDEAEAIRLAKQKLTQSGYRLAEYLEPSVTHRGPTHAGEWWLLFWPVRAVPGSEVFVVIDERQGTLRLQY